MDSRSHSLGPAGISFTVHSPPLASSARPNLLNPVLPASSHRRSASLSGLVKRKSSRRKSGLVTPASQTNNINNPPVLTSILNRGQVSAEPQGDAPPSNVRSSHRHSISFEDIPPHPQPTQALQPDDIHLNTLPIIQPRTTSVWNSSYDMDRRSFRVNLHNPRQQVTSLLALSSVPRPLSPLFNEERENSASVIRAATRTAIEEEAIQAAIAASLQPDLMMTPLPPHLHREQQAAFAHHWADHHRHPRSVVSHLRRSS
ncbi:hypothetical protein PCASD_05503 [Puccinia coronata f. sp. avenae]|uniref:Uncharacterized protein n=1 Tax=Puccinia coronata f. sp. avenae TaxID=200324 RepID=A0A2N5V8P1_9BASI|nr:hypothetical protein PCASD_19062 [Puccinia coronata f. sp. avenae]PLW46360.1 hypothetical protein PCASD_05503 [Puccinia coronata f. sp. avenae]